MATLEDDDIFYTLADLEQFTGQEITWVQNPTFDEVMKKRPFAVRFTAFLYRRNEG